MNHKAKQFFDSLDAVVLAFRLGQEGEGNDQLIALMDVLGESFAHASKSTLLRLSPMLSETLAAIERKDYLWAADLLEYEIAPLLRNGKSM